jgi:hypothetical protein
MKMRANLQFCAAIAAATLALSSVTRAVTLTVPDSVDDYEAQRRSAAGGTPSVPAGTYIAGEAFGTGARVGFQTGFYQSGTTPGGITSVFFFQLPALSPGQSIDAATFGVSVLADSATSATTPTFNGDLYALGVINSITKTAAEAENFFYVGDTAQSALANPLGGPVQRLGDNFLVPSEFVANGGTPNAQSQDITAYIQNLYANPAANGFTPGTSYLALRINPDAGISTGTQRYTLAFQGTGPAPAGNGGAGTDAQRPQITLSIVPEPSSLGLLAVAGLAALRRRRRA